MSFGLSIAVVPMLGMMLNYTPWGIRLIPILVSVIIFIVVLSALALLRRMLLPEDERFIPTLEIDLPVFHEMRLVDRIIYIMLAFVLIFTVLSICYTHPGSAGDNFTEFYILGAEGKTGGYPSDLLVGQKARVTVGVVNHENSATDYLIKVLIGENIYSTIGPFTLSSGETWEKPVQFAANLPVNNLKVAFLLFKEEDGTTPYDSLFLWVNVKKPAIIHNNAGQPGP